MIRLGYVYGNLMVNMQATNEKLTDRARRIIVNIAGVSYDEASRLLSAGGSVRVAILMHKLGLPRSEAEAKLAAAQGRLRVALESTLE
jgi:N-acetylmuramic acid 6-phosphate etherase